MAENTKSKTRASQHAFAPELNQPPHLPCQLKIPPPTPTLQTDNLAEKALIFLNPLDPPNDVQNIEFVLGNFLLDEVNVLHGHT